MLSLGGCQWALLDPKGSIGLAERSILDTATGLMLLVVVPVIVLTIAIVWRYRASNTRAEYRPEWSHSNGIEAVMWSIPIAIVSILAVICWRTSHELDPFRAIPSSQKAVHIEAVALDWKWLFIYPDQHVASVNELAMPVGVPVVFHITSATVMNSFFIPQPRQPDLRHGEHADRRQPGGQRRPAPTAASPPTSTATASPA